MVSLGSKRMTSLGLTLPIKGFHACYQDKSRSSEWLQLSYVHAVQVCGIEYVGSQYDGEHGSGYRRVEERVETWAYIVPGRDEYTRHLLAVERSVKIAI